MNITRVPISRVDDSRSEKIFALVTVFILGVTLGSLAVLTGSGKLNAVPIDASSQLGAVILSDITSPSIENSPTADTITTTDEVTPPSVSRDVALSDARNVANEKSQLTLNITDRTIAIDRLNQEIERVKNTSVALIAEFNTNCANWNDVCAEPYVKKLDENNTTYNNLVGTLNSLRVELASLKSELVSLSN